MKNNVKMIFKQVSMRNRKLNCQCDCTSWQKSEKGCTSAEFVQKRKENNFLHWTFQLQPLWFSGIFRVLSRISLALILATHLYQGSCLRYEGTMSKWLFVAVPTPWLGQEKLRVTFFFTSPQNEYQEMIKCDAHCNGNSVYIFLFWE